MPDAGTIDPSPVPAPPPASPPNPTIYTTDKKTPSEQPPQIQIPVNTITATMSLGVKLLQVVNEIAKSGNLQNITQTGILIVLLYAVLFLIPKARRDDMMDFAGQISNTMESQRELDRTEFREQNAKLIRTLSALEKSVKSWDGKK